MYSRNTRLPALGDLGRISSAAAFRSSARQESQVAPMEHSSAAPKATRASAGLKMYSSGAKPYMMP